MHERRRFSGGAVGGSSLLTVFGVLCLTVFALLSLSTVQADRRLSDKTLDNIELYYAADAQAEETLALIRQGNPPEDVWADGNYYFYSCPISDTQSLEVTVVLEEDGSYTVEQWQAVSTTEWEADLGLDLWLG